MKFFWIFGLLVFSSMISFGQKDSVGTVMPEKIQSDSILASSIDSLDSISTKKKRKNFIGRYFTEDYPSPKKAVILSLILPGTGQIYNKKLWYIKLPLVYGAIGGTIYAIDYNSSQYRLFRDEYKKMVDGIDSTVSIYEGLVSSSVIKAERIRFDKFRQLSYIGLFLAYTLTAAESYVTAHLLSFDVSDDLGMRIQPNLDFAPNQGMTVGLGLNFHFKNKKHESPPIQFTSY